MLGFDLVMIHTLQMINDLIEFDCYDLARFRFHYYWYVMTGKCFGRIPVTMLFYI
jgi:hypothetical protein